MNEYLTSIFWIIFWIICGIWIYNDAKKRNLKDPIAWALLGFLLGIIGVVGYLIMVVRPNKRDS